MEPPQTLSHLLFAFKSTCYHQDFQTHVRAHPEGQVIWYPWSTRSWWWWWEGGGGCVLGFIQQQTQQILTVPWSVSSSPARNKGHPFAKDTFVLKGIFSKTWSCWQGKGKAGLVLKKWDEKGPETWVQITRNCELHWWKMPSDKGCQGCGFSAKLQVLFREFDHKMQAWMWRVLDYCVYKSDHPSST